jgi:hypothetical protein
LAKKLSKAEVLYMPPQVITPGGSPRGASCGECALRVTTLEGENCAFVHIDGTADTRISYKKGICGLYIGGDREFINNPVPTVPRSVAGYVEGRFVPTKCGGCEYYLPSPENKNYGDCAKVEGPIEFWGCCNSFEEK